MTQRYWRCEEGDHSRCAGCRCFCHLFDHGVFRVGTGLVASVKKIVSPAWGYIYGTFPLWRHATHQASLAKAQSEFDSRISAVRAQHVREIDDERKQIETLMPKLVRLTADYRFTASASQGIGRFIVSTQLDDNFVYEVLAAAHRDLRALDYIAERMAYDMVRQIRTIDFARVRAAADYDDSRRSRFGASFSDPRDFRP